MSIKGTLSRVATIGGRVAGTGNVRAKQVSIGSGAGAADLSQKELNELSNVNASETDDGLLKWNFFDRYLVPQWGSYFFPYPIYRLIDPQEFLRFQ